MRKWHSLAAVLAAGLVCAGTASADTPADVYSDYAQDGTLSCGHSRGALNGVLRDASLHQYGDPYTMIGLKLAVRKQLAGGCRRTTQALPAAPSPNPDANGDADPRGSNAPSAPPPAAEDDDGRSGDGSSAEPSDSTHGAAEALAPIEDTRNGWMLLVGIGLLLVVLASGGWAARRAYTDRR